MNRKRKSTETTKKSESEKKTQINPYDMFYAMIPSQDLLEFLNKKISINEKHS